MNEPRPTVSRMMADIASLRRERDILRDALNQIACWSDGGAVTASFDEPASASIARAALERTNPARIPTE